MKGKLVLILALLLVILLLSRSTPRRGGAPDESRVRGMALSDY
jgi:hypothetical protein